ncbi:MAG: MBL fold metallo-hydrolase, partial [Campylobacteraceae bacterium]|nr:MBL fold metallo-hydrolase [Campylobacteraceae bacterium]
MNENKDNVADKKPANPKVQNSTKNSVNKPQGQAKKQNPNRQNRKRKSAKNQPSVLDGNEKWQKDMQSAISANHMIHKERLAKFNQINQNTQAKIKITPLGGLGEIGGNITVIETDTSAIVVDVGMSFPTDDMHGVDILIPDFTYLRQIKKKIKAIVITHAHEDHIGAVAYLFKEMQFPIYATPLPLGILSNKFEE